MSIHVATQSSFHQRARRFFRQAGALTLAAGLASAAFAAGPTGPRLATHDGDASLVLEKTDDGWALLASGQKSASAVLPLAADAHVQKLTTHGSTWLLSAVTREAAGTGPTLVILRGSVSEGTVERLPSPTTAGAMLLQPNVLADAAGELLTAVWIEGETSRRTAVRSARWQGAGWSAPLTLSPVGPGTQIALDAALMDDGSALTVWAAFDGKDDEILWSRLPAASATSSDTWSAPTPLSKNEGPDVTPALLATKSGALLAWSGYDGSDYRVFMRRFDGDAWSSVERLGGRGAVFPAFAQPGDSPVLTFKQTVPAAWRLLALGDEGQVIREATAAARAARPLVLGVDERGATVRWTDSGRIDDKGAGDEQFVTWLAPEKAEQPLGGSR